MNKITTILMDVDNTLLDFEKSAKNTLESLCDKHNIDFSEKMYEIFMELNVFLWEQLEKGEITYEKLHEIRFNLVFEKLNIKDVDGPTFDREFIEISNRIGIPVDNALEILKYLSQKYDVYVASNSSYKRQFTRLTSCNMMPYIKDIFVSHDIGALKPSPVFFDACFEKIDNLKKEQVIMIGDSLSADIAGGKNYNIKTCWYNHTKKTNFDENCADFIVNNLIEIKNIL